MYYDLAYAIKPTAVNTLGQSLFEVDTTVGKFVIRSTSDVTVDSGFVVIRQGCWVPNRILPERMRGSIPNHTGELGAVVSGAVAPNGVRQPFVCIEYDHGFTRPADVTHCLGVVQSNRQLNVRTVTPHQPPVTILDKIVVMDAGVTQPTSPMLYTTLFNRGVIVHITMLNGSPLVQTLHGDVIDNASNFTWNVLRKESIIHKLPLLSETVLIAEVYGSSITNSPQHGTRRGIQLLAAYDRSTKRMYTFSELLTAAKLTGMAVRSTGAEKLSVFMDMTALINFNGE